MIAVLATAASACVGQADPGTTTTGGEQPTTTAVSTTVTSTSTTASSVTTGPVVVTGPDWYWPESQPDAGGAAGSGCAPGTEQLPDGAWFGMMIGYTENEITFDLACWYSGELADQKAAEEGGSADNGYWISNQNPALRTIAVAETAMAWRIAGDISAGEMEQLAFAEWVPEDAVYLICPGELCLVWLRIEAGAVAEILEQYVP